MTLREKLHAQIDRLPETELQKLARRLDAWERSESAGDELDETIALWEVLAEPIEDEEAGRAFAEAVKRRPFFGEREFPVLPD